MHWTTIRREDCTYAVVKWPTADEAMHQYQQVTDGTDGGKEAWAGAPIHDLIDRGELPDVCRAARRVYYDRTGVLSALWNLVDNKTLSEMAILSQYLAMDAQWRIGAATHTVNAGTKPEQAVDLRVLDDSALNDYEESNRTRYQAALLEMVRRKFMQDAYQWVGVDAWVLIAVRHDQRPRVLEASMTAGEGWSALVRRTAGRDAFMWMTTLETTDDRDERHPVLRTQAYDHGRYFLTVADNHTTFYSEG